MKTSGITKEAILEMCTEYERKQHAQLIHPVPPLGLWNRRYLSLMERWNALPPEEKERQQREFFEKHANGS